MKQQSNEAAEPVAQYIKETPENSVFLICRIFGLLLICYFSKLLYILVVVKVQKNIHLCYITTVRVKNKNSSWPLEFPVKIQCGNSE